MLDHIISFFVIFLACSVVEIVFRQLDRAANKQREECLCDICRKPKKLLRTKDSKFWACRACIKARNANQITENNS